MAHPHPPAFHLPWTWMLRTWNSGQSCGAGSVICTIRRLRAGPLPGHHLFGHFGRKEITCSVKTESTQIAERQEGPGCSVLSYLMPPKGPWVPCPSSMPKLQLCLCVISRTILKAPYSSPLHQNTLCHSPAGTKISGLPVRPHPTSVSLSSPSWWSSRCCCCSRLVCSSPCLARAHNPLTFPAASSTIK